jgi:hypothetical protein
MLKITPEYKYTNAEGHTCLVFETAIPLWIQEPETDCSSFRFTIQTQVVETVTDHNEPYLVSEDVTYGFDVGALTEMLVGLGDTFPDQTDGYNDWVVEYIQAEADREN